MNTKNTKTTKIILPSFLPLSTFEFKSLKLNDTQKQILFGCALGDIYLQLQSGGKNYRARFQQQYPAHENYVLELFNVFKNFCGSLPIITERETNNTSDIRFQTKSHSEFNNFGQLFYMNKKKTLPSDQEINKWLTSLAFTYWYMDDGGIETANPNACTLNTHAFEPNDVERLIVIINQKFNLEAYSRSNKDRQIIVIPARSCQKLQNLMTPHIIDCMKYKIPGKK